MFRRQTANQDLRAARFWGWLLLMTSTPSAGAAPYVVQSELIGPRARRYRLRLNQPDYLLEAKYSISPTLPGSIDAFAGKAVKLNSPVLV